MKYSKSLLIAIAAFAVTATGAQAYVGNKHLQRSGLSASQVSAFTEARELQSKGEFKKARNLLVSAGVNEGSISQLRKATHSAHTAVRKAVEVNDYEAFKLAAVGTPLADIIVTESDFAQFVEAYQVKTDGNYQLSRSMLHELGLPGGVAMSQQTGKSHHHRFARGGG